MRYFRLGSNFNSATISGILALDGGQIAFPATQNPSADANTLDDYEEGSWTPGLTFGGGSTGMTVANSDGEYTKIGRLVTVNGTLALSAKGSSTGEARITGLTFAVPDLLSGVLSEASGSFSFYLNMAFTKEPGLYANQGGTTLVVTDGGVGASEADFTDTSTIRFSITYFA